MQRSFNVKTFFVALFVDLLSSTEVLAFSKTFSATVALNDHDVIGPSTHLLIREIHDLSAESLAFNLSLRAQRRRGYLPGPALKARMTLKPSRPALAIRESRHFSPATQLFGLCLNLARIILSLKDYYPSTANSFHPHQGLSVLTLWSPHKAPTKCEEA